MSNNPYPTARELSREAWIDGLIAEQDAWDARYGSIIAACREALDDLGPPPIALNVQGHDWDSVIGVIAETADVRPVDEVDDDFDPVADAACQRNDYERKSA